MAKQDEIWVGLAQELLARPDVRPDVKSRLEATLEAGEPEAIATRVREVLAAEVAASSRSERPRAASPAHTQPSPQDRAAARQAHALLNHGLRAAEQASGGEISQRLFHFLRDALDRYGAAYAQAGAPRDMESAEAASARVLQAVSARTVPGRSARVGVLTPAEVSALAAGRVRADQLATVRASGDWERDVERWRQDGSVDAGRRAALASPALRDGEYVLAVIQPGDDGERVDVYPIAGNGQAAQRPVARLSAPPSVERVSVASALVRPAVAQRKARTQAGARPAAVRRASPARAARQREGLSEARQAAIAVGQARVAMYADILRGRSDLHGAARRAAERRLERMREESEALVGATSIEQVRGLAGKWQRELGTDISRFAERGLDPIGGEAARLETLSRLGALGVRLDELTRAGTDAEPGARALRGGGEARELVRSLEPADSVFDTLPGPSVSAAAQRAEARPVPGESLAAGVILEGARRAASPTAGKQQGLRELAGAGRRLRQALTSADAMRRSGLALSSSLMPLLRAEMPSDIRPDMRSPLLRSVLLPAMHQVSGRGRTAARREGGAGSGPGAGPQIPANPEALFAMLLGEEGLSLIENMPSLARNIMTQMGGLAERLGSAGEMPNLQALERAGEVLRERLSGLSMIPEGVPDLDQIGDTVRDREVGEAVGMSLQEAAGDFVSEAGIDDVAGALAEEGQALTGALKDKIKQYVDIPSDTRLFAGPVATAALGEMGALGASVGRDIYVREDVLARGGADAAAIVGHEAVHADRSRRGAGSVETEEKEAYRVEGLIRDSFNLSELVREQPPAPGGASAPAGAPSGEAEANEGMKRGALIEELVSAVSDLMSWEVFAGRQRTGSPG